MEPPDAAEVAPSSGGAAGAAGGRAEQGPQLQARVYQLELLELAKKRNVSSRGIL